MNKGFVVVTIVAFVLCLIEFVLWICNVFSFSVIDAGTFISVLVTILAIIVTIVIGWQVFNIIEFKDKQEKFEIKQKELQDQNQKSLKELQEDLSTGIKYVSRMSIIPGYLDRKEFVGALNTLFIALNDLMNLNKLQGFEKNVDVVIILINEYVSKCSESDMLTLWTRIKDTDEKIRNAKNFSMISEKYEDIIKRIKES